MTGSMRRAGLPIFVDVAGRPVIVLGTGPAADAKRRVVERAGGIVAGEEGEAALAIVAIDDDGIAGVTVARLKARGLLVNAVDRPDLCDFTLPAIVDRDPVLIAIGTGGASAGLAAALRQRLEALLPVSLGTLARAFETAREALRARYPQADMRRRAIATMLAEGGALDPLVAHDAPDPLATTSVTPQRSARIVITSPDPDDLTLRAARLLGSADRVYHPADMAAAILDRARADAVRIVGAAPAIADSGLTVELVWARA